MQRGGSKQTLIALIYEQDGEKTGLVELLKKTEAQVK